MGLPVRLHGGAKGARPDRISAATIVNFELDESIRCDPILFDEKGASGEAKLIHLVRGEHTCVMYARHY